MTLDIEQLCREALEDDAKATPGPWSVPDGFFGADANSRRYDDDQVAIAGPPSNGVGGFQDAIVSVIWYDGGHLIVSRADADFIAAARTREPLLAAALLAERKKSERLRAEIGRSHRRPPMGCSTCEDHNQALHEENMRLENENAELRKVISEDKALLLESRDNLRCAVHEVLDELMFADDRVDMHIDYRDAAVKVRGLVEKRRDLEAKLAAMTEARDGACIALESLLDKFHPIELYLPVELRSALTTFRVELIAFRAVGKESES